MKKGAENAYLQVVQGNTAAKRLYASLGFTDFYTYWFRVQPEACLLYTSSWTDRPAILYCG